MVTELLRIATAGSVDDGKSTLIGRLLVDTRQVLDDQLGDVERASRRRGDAYVDLALLTDGLCAEREQGITIDVAYRPFATARRKFIIADTPGHARYTRNMVTGASTADVALVLVDARKGAVEQSRRHLFLASLLGVSHVVVCVNKMDLVDFRESVFDALREEIAAFATKLKVPDLTFIPLSALHGDGVASSSPRLAWYRGPSLLYHLETVHVASDKNLVDARFPVQWVIRPVDEAHRDYRGYAGVVEGGVFRPGDEIVILPGNARSRIRAIETFDGPVLEAFPPMSVTIRLEDDLDVSRGDMVCRPGNVPHVSQKAEALLCWMTDTSRTSPTTAYVLAHTTRTTRARIEQIRYRIDVTTLHRERDVDTLGLNEIGRVRLRTTSPICFDAYAKNRATGGFVLIDETTNETVAAGMFLETRVAEALPEADGPLSRDVRFDALGQRGAVVWVTGLPAAGKSTLATALEGRLVRAGNFACVLDGDELRRRLNRDLGLSPEDRRENVRRAAEVARLVADAGAIAIVALISPYRDDRNEARRSIEEAGLVFLEVHVDTSLAECERRDPKRLYRRARSGELVGLTGIDAPYEPPVAPDLRFDEEVTVSNATADLVRELRRRGLVR